VVTNIYLKAKKFNEKRKKAEFLVGFSKKIKKLLKTIDKHFTRW